MPWMIALILVIAGLCFTGFVMRASAQEKGPVTVETVTQASNPEIEQMLREIETRPAPEPIPRSCRSPIRSPRSTPPSAPRSSMASAPRAASTPGRCW